MTYTKCRVGFPYDSSKPNKVKESVVVLSPYTDTGFTYVFKGDNKYSILHDQQTNCLISPYRNNGLLGILIESNDERESIAKEGEIHGRGTSMQLAVVLALVAKYNNEKIDNLPLILFSGAINYPPVKPFLNATIETYEDDIELLEKSLINKYKAAKMAKAYALVMPNRDAKILSNALKEECKTIDDINFANFQENDKPMIIGISTFSLPDLATKIGINPYYFIQFPYYKKYIALFLLFMLIFFLGFYFFSQEKQYSHGEQFWKFNSKAAKYALHDLCKFATKQQKLLFTIGYKNLVGNMYNDNNRDIDTKELFLALKKSEEFKGSSLAKEDFDKSIIIYQDFKNQLAEIEKKFFKEMSQFYLDASLILEIDSVIELYDNEYLQIVADIDFFYDIRNSIRLITKEEGWLAFLQSHQSVICSAVPVKQQSSGNFGLKIFQYREWILTKIIRFLVSKDIMINLARGKDIGKFSNDGTNILHYLAENKDFFEMCDDEKQKKNILQEFQRLDMNQQENKDLYEKFQSASNRLKIFREKNIPYLKDAINNLLKKEKNLKEAKDPKGKTALEIAEGNGNSYMIEILEEKQEK